MADPAFLLSTGQRSRAVPVSASHHEDWKVRTPFPLPHITKGRRKACPMVKRPGLMIRRIRSRLTVCGGGVTVPDAAATIEIEDPPGGDHGCAC